ncbi:MAG: hypothetical protein K1W19_08195 [Lachnospiraceae bacterium]
MSKFENDYYNKGYEDGFEDGVNSTDSIEFELEKYAIWKDHKIIGYVELTEEQKESLNGTKGIDVYFEKV